MNQYPGGVWPVMITPFTEEGAVDEEGLRALVEWYIAKGVDGLFASCQSSEIFQMTYEERIRIARITVEQAAGRVPVVASGFTDYGLTEQVRNVYAMRDTGVDAVILLTNRLGCEGESDDVLLRRMDALLKAVDPDIRLGLYECPNPYKRLLTPRVVRAAAETDRFYFLKDTCLNAAQIHEKVAIMQGSNLRLYNANTATLLQTLREGAHGYSGVMANFHPDLYVWLTRNINHANAEKVQHVLTAASLIERQLYPVNAKYHLRQIEGLPITIRSRAQNDALLKPEFMEEIRQVDQMIRDTRQELCL